eukprot:5015294-Prymnesium_polylepis.1
MTPSSACRAPPTTRGAAHVSGGRSDTCRECGVRRRAHTGARGGPLVVGFFSTGAHLGVQRALRHKVEGLRGVHARRVLVAALHVRQEALLLVRRREVAHAAVGELEVSVHTPRARADPLGVVERRARLREGRRLVEDDDDFAEAFASHRVVRQPPQRGRIRQHEVVPLRERSEAARAA